MDIYEIIKRYYSQIVSSLEDTDEGILEEDIYIINAYISSVRLHEKGNDLSCGFKIGLEITIDYKYEYSDLIKNAVILLPLRAEIDFE
jgi:hypothetical protein